MKKTTWTIIMANKSLWPKDNRPNKRAFKAIFMILYC